MKYRVLGKSGIQVSAVGVGGHQNMAPKTTLSAAQQAAYLTDFEKQIHVMSHQERAKIIGRALELGINYFDTSLDMETESMGHSLKILGQREKCVITLVAGVMQYMLPDTRTSWAKKAVAQDIDRGLQLFGSDYFDVCLTCMCNQWYGDAMIEGALEAMAEAKAAGKIRASGISDHQDGQFLASVIEKYHDGLDMVMYPFSYIRRTAARKIMPLTHKYDLGYVAMKPLQRREVLKDPGLQKYAREKELPPTAGAIHWVLEQPEVSVALAAVNSLEEIEENAKGGQ